MMSGDLTARIMFARPLGVAVRADHRQVRDALFAKKLKPGDVLGTENEIAARYGVSRIVARDALRTLQALGIAEIRMGKGGGARVARGNPRLFAEALAVQLDLTGVTPPRSWTRSARSRARRRARRRERHRRRHRELRGIVADSADVQRRRASPSLSPVPSRRRRGLAQPRAGGAAHLAAARVVAAAQSRHERGSRPAHSRRSQGISWR